VTLHDLSRAVLALDRSGGSRVVGREPPAFDDESAREAVETMAAQLHHVHLPRLVSAGLVVYDACDSVVTDWSHPAVGDRWLTAPPIDRLATVIADDRVQSMHAD
jgi:hypothetical protein